MNECKKRHLDALAGNLHLATKYIHRHETAKARARLLRLIRHATKVLLDL